MCIREACCSARQGFCPNNGMYQMTFTDFGNVSVMVGDSINKTCAGCYIYEPDENGVITFRDPAAFLLQSRSFGREHADVF